MGASHEYKKRDFESEFTEKTDWDDIGSELFQDKREYTWNSEGTLEVSIVPGHEEKKGSELENKLNEYRNSKQAKELEKARFELKRIYRDDNAKIDELYDRAKSGDGEIRILRDTRKTLSKVNYENGTKREAKWAKKYKNRDKKPFFMRKSKWNKIQNAKSKIFFEVENPDYGKITGKYFHADDGTRDGEFYDLIKMEREVKAVKAKAKEYEDEYIFGENEVVLDVFDKKIKEKQARDHRKENQ